jgi:hypothetical protein
MTYQATGLDPQTVYYFTAKAKNSSADSGFSNIATVTTKAELPKLTMIKDSVESLILSMTQTGGYNYDWLSASQHDLAKVIGFPAAVFEFDPTEENEDSMTGPDSNAYANRVTLKIDSYNEISYAETVTDGETAIPDDPPCAFKLVMDKMLDDLKRLFGRNWYLTADTGVENIVYKRHNRVWSNAGDALKPGKLESFWEITYCQDRLEPTLTAP